MEFPSHYLITPVPDDEARFMAALERTLQGGTRLVQLKHKGLDAAAYEALAVKAIRLAHGVGGKVLLTGDAERVQRLGADGLHLDSKALMAADRRPLPEPYLVSVSGHTQDALQHGQEIGADFAVLSPIRYTKAHPDIQPHGWEGLAAIAAGLQIPVYALGGVDAKDEPEAIRAGAQGIAGNRGYWKP